MRALLQLLLLLVVVAILATNTRAQQAPISNQQELIFPIVSIGPAGGGLHFQTSFHFQNMSNSTVKGELAFFGRDGSDSTAWLACQGDVLNPVPQADGRLPSSPLLKDLSPVPAVTRLVIEIPPGGTVRRTGIGGIFNIELIEGWAVFNWEGLPTIEAATELALIEGAPPDCTPLRDIPAERVVAGVVVAATRAAFEVRLPFVISARRETAISVVNASGDTATNLELTFVDHDGVTRDTNTVPLDFLNRKSLLAFEWSIEGKVFTAPITRPRRPEDLTGTVIIRSDRPIAVAAIDIILDRLGFLTVPIRLPLVPPFPL